VPRPNVVELVKQPTYLIPNDKKLVPQGGTPHFQNKSTQNPRSTGSEPLPLLSLEERSTRYYASAMELALSEFAPGDRVERASAESEIPASPSRAAHLYPVNLHPVPCFYLFSPAANSVHGPAFMSRRIGACQEYSG